MSWTSSDPLTVRRFECHQNHPKPANTGSVDDLQLAARSHGLLFLAVVYRTSLLLINHVTYVHRGTRGKQTESPSSHDPLEVTSKDPWVPNDLENRGSGQPLSFKKLFRSSNKQPKEEKLVWVENWDAEYQQQSNYQQQRRRNSNHHHQYQGVSTEHPPSRHDVARNTTRHHHRPESFYPHHQSSLSTSHIVMATPVTCYYHVSPAAQYVFYQPLYYHMPVMTSTPTSSTQGQHPHHYVYPEVHSQEHPVYNTYTSRTDTDNDDMHRRASTISDTTSSAESTRRASNGSSTISTHSTAGSSVITIPEEDKEPGKSNKKKREVSRDISFIPYHTRSIARDTCTHRLQCF